MSTPAVLDPRLQALLDKDEIRQVVYDFARGADRHDWDLVRSCYHPGATDDHGVFSGDAMEYVDWLSVNLAKLAGVTMHFVMNVNIELDGDVAHAESYSIGTHRYTRPDGRRADFFDGARYVDRFERRDGAWRIASRVLVWDWVRDELLGTEFEGFGVDPATLTWGTHGPADPSSTHGRV